MEYIKLILALAGGITVIGAGTSWIIKAINPFTQLKLRVDNQDKKLENDNLRLLKIEEANKPILSGILAILKHLETGNCTGEMSKAKKEIENYLIDRS